MPPRMLACLWDSGKRDPMLLILWDSGKRSNAANHVGLW